MEKQKFYTLFNTGAEISVINSVAFKNLDLFDRIYDSNILVRNASGKSMDPKGKVTLKFDINGRKYTHTFIVCGSLKRKVIIGCDFLIRNSMTNGWDDNENNKPIKVPKDQFRILIQSPEHSEDNMLQPNRSITIPPRHVVVAEVTCKDLLAGQHILASDSSLMFKNLNLKFESMCYDNPEETQAKVLPVILKNLDSSQYICIPAKTVVAFAKTEDGNEVTYAEIAEIKNSTDSVEEQCRNWLPKETPKSDFIILPADKRNIEKSTYHKDNVHKQQKTN